jgi:hypothetical protein
VLKLWLWLPRAPRLIACVGRCCPLLRDLALFAVYCLDGSLGGTSSNDDNNNNNDERPLFPVLKQLAVRLLEPRFDEDLWS